jgi:MoxR-like ATPase
MSNAPRLDPDWRAGASRAPLEAVDDPTAPAADVLGAVTGVVLGHDAAVRIAVAAFLAEGHVLLEDSPGVGKTLLGKALARAIGGTFGRVQATADLLPSDVTGVSVFDPDERTWTFRPGPIFNNVVLVDELNRATPRAQAALLEAMAEGHVTVDGTSHPLPRPFFVIATQNPGGDHGTFPLVAGQRDRFAARLHLGIPSRDTERALLRGEGGRGQLDAVEAVATPATWTAAQHAVVEVHAADLVVDYVADVAAAIRAHPEGDPLLSPRASLMLLRVARARAWLDGRDYVLPDDVKAVAAAALAHRLAGDLPLGNAAAATRVGAILDGVAVPPVTP